MELVIPPWSTMDLLNLITAQIVTLFPLFLGIRKLQGLQMFMNLLNFLIYSTCKPWE
jgi:hypothetical protein